MRSQVARPTNSFYRIPPFITVARLPQGVLEMVLADSCRSDYFQSATTLPFGGVEVMVKIITRDLLSRSSNDSRLDE